MEKPSGRRGGRRLARVHFLAMGLAAASAAEGAGAAPPLSPPRIFVFGTELPQAMEYRLVIEQDIAMPDMALLTLTGSAGLAFAERVRIGDPMLVTSSAVPPGTLFAGDVVAVEGGCDSPDRVVVRALNRQPILGRPRAGGTIRVDTFHPRLSSSVTVQKVVVRGWDPQRRMEIVGEATAPAIVLGEPGSQGTALGATEEFTVDHPIFSADEAMTIAKTKLEEQTASDVSAEAETGGPAALRAGQSVTVEGSGDSFNGKYLVHGVSHRYTHSRDDSGGYRTMLKLFRQDHGLFFLPEIDDEVLVAFEHGDVRQPYVVASLWDGDDAACSTDRRRPD